MSPAQSCPTRQNSYRWGGGGGGIRINSQFQPGPIIFFNVHVYHTIAGDFRKVTEMVDLAPQAYLLSQLFSEINIARYHFTSLIQIVRSMLVESKSWSSIIIKRWFLCCLLSIILLLRALCATRLSSACWYSVHNVNAYATRDAMASIVRTSGRGHVYACAALIAHARLS